MGINFGSLFAELNVVSIIFRLLLATIFGGIIGFERGQKRRPAGFRTHMLVCIGSTLAMLVNQYINLKYASVDPARLGAQVISGIGFLGAGTIIVTGKRQVKGLTTAAGLWASACMGLAIGIGFYSAAIIACIFIFSVMTLLHKIDSQAFSSSKTINLYLEFSAANSLGTFIAATKQKEIKIVDIEISRAKTTQGKTTVALVTLLLPVATEHAEIIAFVGSIEGITAIEEI